MNQNQIKKPIVILRPAEVAAKKGITRTGQFELLKAEDFPKPIKLSGARSIGFVESEIDEWLEKRMAARDASGKSTRIKKSLDVVLQASNLMQCDPPVAGNQALPSAPLNTAKGGA